MRPRAARLLVVWLAAGVAVAGCRSASSSGSQPGDAGTVDEASSPVAREDADPSPPPDLAGVTPGFAFLAREREVLVRGYATRWANPMLAGLGSGVTVTNVSAAEPDLLSVDFTVAATALPGPRDLTVADADGGVLVARGAVTLTSPVALTFDGTVAQGSLAIAHVAVLDPTIPLDTTTTTDPFGHATFTGLAPVLPAGLSGQVLTATPYETDVELFIDEGASGPLSFDLTSGAPDAGVETHFPSPQGVVVAPRAPFPLAAGALVTGTVASPYATDLYEYLPPATAPAILDFAATNLSGAGDAAILLLPSSGRWADQLTGGAVATWVSTSTDPIFGVFFDDSGTTGSYAVGVTATTPASTAATTPADATMAGAIVAPALPFVLTGGSLTSSASADWVEVTTGPADDGKMLHVQSAGDPHTFLDVTVYDADGATSIGGNETGGPVSARAGPLSASRVYYVVFTAGSGFDPAHGAYVGILRIE